MNSGSGLWGKKIGMTQIFSEGQKVVPVTVIDVAHWYITQIKTHEKDGYNAVKMGQVKSKYADQAFSQDWLKNPKKYFSTFKEIRNTAEHDQDVNQVAIGQEANIALLAQGDMVDVFGITKGAGFQGVVKRHGFAGGRASHGATFGRFTGSLSHMRSRGRVIKGKKMPGHMGQEQRVMKNLQIVRIEPDARVVLVKGSVPGKSGSLVFMRKSR
jgi:large subunit ribosomal protein L3